MISMTGFGHGEFLVGDRAFRVEARSFNNRFLDIKIRLPWIDGELESRTLALVRRRVTRGRIEINAQEERTGHPELGLHLDETAAAALGRVLQRLATLIGADQATAARLLPPQKDLLGQEGGPLPADLVWPALERGLEVALDGLTGMRRREGEAIAADMVAHLGELAEHCDRIRALATGEPERARRRLDERLARLLGESAPLDPARLAEEVALLADRADISEELARLQSHLTQLESMLKAEGEIGRRFEFMLQELHRELNTIASKTMSAEVAHRVVDAKGAVERMREQAQNVE